MPEPGRGRAPDETPDVLRYGAITTSYMNVISGLSKTADIEKKLFYGIHGPKEVVVILIKRKPLPQEWKESAFCIGCGGCILECPVYLEKGSVFGTHYKQGGIGVISSSIKKGIPEGIKDGLFSCTTCLAHALRTARSA